MKEINEGFLIILKVSEKKKNKKRRRIAVKNRLVNTPAFYFIVSNTHDLGNFFKKQIHNATTHTC